MSAIPPLGGGGMDFDPKRRHPYQPDKKDGDKDKKPEDAEKAEELTAEEIEKIRIELRKRIKSDGRGERLDEIV